MAPTIAHAFQFRKRGLAEGRGRTHLALLDLTLIGTDGIELMQGILEVAHVTVDVLSG